LTPSAISAIRTGVRVSSRAKNAGARIFTNEKPTRPIAYARSASAVMLTSLVLNSPRKNIVVTSGSASRKRPMAAGTAISMASFSVQSSVPLNAS